ncbi:hypothetical protein KAU32_12465 [bacterium]|nr:hypothetical protein [bacterium]
MKKLLILVLALFFVAGTFADTGDLGGASVAVRDPWNDAEFLPAAAAFYPGGGEFKLDFDYSSNTTKYYEYYCYYNSTGATNDNEYEMKDKMTGIKPVLKGRMRFGPLAASLRFAAPIQVVKTTNNEYRDYDLTAPNTDWWSDDDEVSLKNGFPIDLGLKIGFAFSEMMGVGLMFNLFNETFTNFESSITKDENGITGNWEREMEIGISEIQFGAGLIFHLNKLIGGLSFQMSNLSATARETSNKQWNGSALEEYWTDDLDNYPRTHITYNGFRLNGIVRLISSPKLTLGLAFVFDHFVPEVEMEYATMKFPPAINGYVNLINIAPGFWFRDKFFELAADFLVMLPSGGIDMVTYTSPPPDGQEITGNMSLKGFIWIFRSGGVFKLSDTVRVNIGYQRLNVSGSMLQEQYAWSSSPVYTQSESETSMSNLLGLSNNAFIFSFFYDIADGISLNYKLTVGTYLDENDPNFIKTLLPMGALTSGTGNIDIARTMTHKIALTYLIR